jgi:hypothetical protein
MSELDRIRPEELDAEEGTAIPDKEVMSLLDLFVNIDLALDLAAPIDLAVAANANAALPIDASVTANVLSADSTAQAMSTQGVAIGQYLNADAIAHAPQDAAIDQGNDVIDGGATATDGQADAGTPDGTPDAGTPSPVESSTTSAVDPVTGELVDVPVDQLLSDGLLNVDVNVSLDADVAAPIAGAVAANANVAAPIDASVAANIASTGSTATAIADQTAVINQTIEDSTAQATAEQTADIQQ